MMDWLINGSMFQRLRMINVMWLWSHLKRTMGWHLRRGWCRWKVQDGNRCRGKMGTRMRNMMGCRGHLQGPRAGDILGWGQRCNIVVVEVVDILRIRLRTPGQLFDHWWT